MGNSYTEEWKNVESWESQGLSYSEQTEALSFTGQEFIESAILNLEIPEGTKSFSFSLKSGNMNESGDTGYVTVGFGDGDDAMGFRSNGITSTSYVVTTLGSSTDPINITNDYKNMFIRIEAKNPDKNEVDFCFKDLEVKFYNQKGKVDFYGNLTTETFVQTNTDEKVTAPDNTPRLLIFVLIVAALGGGVFAYKKLKDRMYTL